MPIGTDPLSIKLLSWNINDFGELKSGIKNGNQDIINAIAQVVCFSNVDIFILNELKFHREFQARSAAERMARALQNHAEAGSKDFSHCILSAKNATGYTAFFIKNASQTIPMPLQKHKGVPVNNLLSAKNPISHVTFQATLPTQGQVVYDRMFPLMVPDLALDYTRPTATSKTPVKPWPGDNCPVVACFYIKGAPEAKAVLPILSCNFAQQEALASHQLKCLTYFSLLRGIGPRPRSKKSKLKMLAPVNIMLQNPGKVIQHQDLTRVVLSGGFNQDYSATAYFSLINKRFPQLHQTIANDYRTKKKTQKPDTGVMNDTVLMELAAFNEEENKTTASLATTNTDNFFIGNANSATSPIQESYDSVIDVAGMLSTKKVRLHSSIQYYQKLDPSTYPKGKGKPYIIDFVNQLVGEDEINMQGTLTGTRLISDHLPVTIQINL